MSTVRVRYIVHDVDAAIPFYTDCLGFAVVMHPVPSFAILQREDLRLLLSAPSERGGGGQTLADGRQPEPGGWNRISLDVKDLEVAVEELKVKGARFRSEIIRGVGGDQVLVDDPSGNCIELFQQR
jgi:catechol 2,3-dioxygenase-like lactoylglutathione lyase family enzyme